MSGTITYIHTASESRGPTQSRDVVLAVEGMGVEGDRTFGRGDKRQITIVSTEELEKAGAELGQPVEPGSTRRNVTVSGVELLREQGMIIRLGDVVVEVSGDCTPCDLMETSVGTGARAALANRAGVTGRIIEGGTISVGDPAIVEAG